MKKLLVLLLALSMVVSVCCACGKTDETPTENSTETPTVNDAETPTNSNGSEITPPPDTPPEEYVPTEPIENIEANDRLVFETFLAMTIMSSMETAPHDAIYPYLAHGNVSCYVDSESLDAYTDDMKVTLENCIDGYWQYNDDARTVEGVEYTATAGNMYGFTVTFYPQDVDGVRCYVLADGILNEFIKDNGDIIYECGAAPDYAANGTLSTMSNTALYESVKSYVGEKMIIQSDRYKNSPVTAFFYVNQAGMLNAVYSYAGEFIFD